MMKDSSLGFLTDESAMASLIRQFDWSATSIGPIHEWPPLIKHTLGIILQCKVPIVTMWGDVGTMIYNDAYAAVAAGRHPDLLGMGVREGWPEVSAFNDNVMRTVLGGEALHYEDVELVLQRNNATEQLYFNLDYSPILDTQGKICGVLAIVTETTPNVEADQWKRDERERLRSMFEQAPGFIAMLTGPDHVFELTNASYRQLIGRAEVVGRSVREALPDLEGQGFFELLDKVYSSGTAYEGRAVPVDFRNSPTSAAQRKFVDLVYQPIFDAAGTVIGIFAQGTDVTERVAAEEALRRTERQSRQILDGAADYAILSLDLGGRIVRWNEGARRLFGWSAEEVAGRNWSMLFASEDRAAGGPAEAIQAAMDNGTAHHERWHVRKSGQRFWATGSISRLLDEAGEPFGFVKVLRDSTDEHVAALALKEAEGRLTRAQEAGGVGVFSLDLQTSMLSPTPEFCRIFGIPPAESVQVEQIEALLFPEDLSSASDPVSRRAGASPLEVEYRIRRASDGQVRVIARQAEFEYDSYGKPVRLSGVVQDVTDRKKAQRELKESEEKFRALAQAIPNQVWTASRTGMLDWFNDRTLHYTGLSPANLRGEGWTEVVHPDDLANATAAWTSSLAQGKAYEIEFRLRRHDGVYRWHIARAVPIVADGEVVQWIGTNTDIHEQRESRAKLEELNRTLEERVAERTADRNRMWRLSTDIMLVASFQADIVAVNPAWTTIFAWEEQELLGRSFMELVHPDDVESTLSEVGKLADGVTTFSFENRYRAKDGSYRTISWTAVPDERHIHAVGRDVTDERQAALALRNTERALQQAQKMEAIGNLTGGVAHDFNNLLQVVAGNLQLLARDVSGNERAQRRISGALSGVERGAKLASQLLSFGRRQALDPRVVNAGRLLQGMADMMGRAIGEGIEVETVVSAGLWNTLVDPAQLENAVLNLAINARDAMEGYGKLTIEAGNAFVDDLYARHHQEVEPGQYVVLAVTDTGVGMDAALLEKVFEPFFSTKAEGKGSGLGLSMVYGFVKQSGGHVKIYSEPGNGTTVMMYLPRCMGQEDVDAVASEGPAEGGPETILVVEDDGEVRATVVDMLKDLGYRVLKASDATAAMVVIESGIHVDLLFTDVVMPGPLKSSEMARKAQERLPSLAVLFTSGYTENSIVHGGRLDPGVQLLSKPYTKEALARKIRQVLDLRKRERSTSGAVTPQDAAQAVQPPAYPSGSPLRVLVVEDDFLIRAAAAEMLEELQCEVFEASSAEEALRFLEENHVDAVVTDLGLPGMSGEEFCRKVRERWASVSLVFATGAATSPQLEDATRSALLAKPYTFEELRHALETATERPLGNGSERK